MMRLLPWPGAAAAGLLFSLVAGPVYRARDPEKFELNASVRASAPGAFVALSDGYTHYELGGPPGKRVVVLAAGATVPYYIWDPTFNALTAAGFRVLRYDYYGRGYSDRPNIAYTQNMYVRQLTQLLDALNIREPIDLAGISFGGSLITSFANRYPQRVRSLVYVDPGFREPYSIDDIAGSKAAWDFFTAIFDENTWPDDQLDDFLHPEKFPDWPGRYRVQLQYKGFRRARLSEIVSNANADQKDEIIRVGRHSRPVLAFWGKQDTNVPFENSADFMKAFPRARLVAVDSAGHLPQWEQPGIVNAEWIRFLKQ
jgi:pimeloyl-ACP methyl ester carboxylesterase